MAGTEPDSSPEEESTDAVEAEELTQGRQGVDAMTGKTAPGATRGEGEIRPEAAEMGAGENIALHPPPPPPGNALDRSLIPSFPFIPASCRDFE